MSKLLMLQHQDWNPKDQKSSPLHQIQTGRSHHMFRRCCHLWIENILRNCRKSLQKVHWILGDYSSTADSRGFTHVLWLLVPPIVSDLLAQIDQHMVASVVSRSKKLLNFTPPFFIPHFVILQDCQYFIGCSTQDVSWLPMKYDGKVNDT